MKNKKHILLLTLIMFAALLLNSCGHMICTKGSGNIVKSDRNTSEFNDVVMRGSGNIYITQAPETKVTVETDDNLQENIIVANNGSTLVIESEGNICPNKFNVYVSTPNVNGLTMQGSGNIKSKSLIESDRMEITISGSGNIDVNAESEDLSILINGSGDAELIGKTTKASLEINGSGDINMYKMPCDKCAININGSGNCKILVNELLDVSINGSGDITYRGQPKEIEQSIRGSGKIKKSKKQENH